MSSSALDPFVTTEFRVFLKDSSAIFPNGVLIYFDCIFDEALDHRELESFAAMNFSVAVMESISIVLANPCCLTDERNFNPTVDPPAIGFPINPLGITSKATFSAASVTVEALRIGERIAEATRSQLFLLGADAA